VGSSWWGGFPCLQTLPDSSRALRKPCDMKGFVPPPEGSSSALWFAQASLGKGCQHQKVVTGARIIHHHETNGRVCVSPS
jgi:hypothetical protein